MCQFRDIFCNKKRPSKKGQIPTHFLGKLKRSKTKKFHPFSPLTVDLSSLSPCVVLGVYFAVFRPFSCGRVCFSVRVFFVRFWGVFGGRSVCGFVCASFEHKKRRRARGGCAVLRLMVCACGLGLFGFDWYF